MPTVPQEDIDWTSKEFDSAKFGDKRLMQQAIEIIRAYTLRWEIEVLSRVLKTGCKIEQLQRKSIRQ